MKAVLVREPGGADRMEVAEVPTPSPTAGTVLVRVASAGVNFIDVYFRSGLYKADLPLTLGSEAAGVVEAVGAGVSDFAPGDRVAYAMVRGAYAEFAVVPASQLVKVPDGVDLESAAAVMLQGMTAHYLTHSTFPLGPLHSCLVHAAAGGTGRLLVQMAKARGARVFGTVSTDEKAAVAREAGVDEAIVYTRVDFDAEVKRLTGGRGVDVVYDSVGRTTFDKSLASLQPRGLLALFGQSSGAVPPLDPQVLNARGSLYLTRPSLAHYLGSRDELVWRAGDVMRGLQTGALSLKIDRTYPLSSAADAHRDLEERRTTGKLLLQPGG